MSAFVRGARSNEGRGDSARGGTASSVRVRGYAGAAYTGSSLEKEEVSTSILQKEKRYETPVKISWQPSKEEVLEKHHVSKNSSKAPWQDASKTGFGLEN